MKQIILSMFFCLAAAMTAEAKADTLYVYNPAVPLLKGNADNVLMYIKADCSETVQGASLTIDFDTSCRNCISELRLYYSGVEASAVVSGGRFAPVGYISSRGEADLSHSVLLDEVISPLGKVSLSTDKTLPQGVNYLWVSVRLSDCCSLTERIGARLHKASLGSEAVPVADLSRTDASRRVAIPIRRAGDDGAGAYRIPGIVTTASGVLVAVYDIRYNGSADLQEHIDIGLSRSTDGGRSWQPMSIPLTFSGYGNLPDSQNGVGDPCILYDPVRDRLWIAALWCHGMGNNRAWTHSSEGMSPLETGQLVLVSSDDQGQTWSAAVNITSMVKDPSWRLLLQGPGRGTVTADGTLVFPIQYIASDGIPYAGIMYSRDAGESWSISRPARSNVTEAQAVQLSDGSIMLNMRDNRGASRAVSVTDDLGRTWSEHPSSRSALREPVCMASLLRVEPACNALGKDILVFSNPDSERHRKDMTIKGSLDSGGTWPEAFSVLIDEGYSRGYSCLTLVDAEHLGILYESSVADIVFQIVPLEDLFARE